MYSNRLCFPSGALVHLGTTSDYLTWLRVAKTIPTLWVRSRLAITKDGGP